MKNQNPSQEKQILSHLKSGRSLTPYEALVQYGSLRLSGRIFRLRKQGHDIQDKWITTDSGKRVKRYFIPYTPVI